MIAYLMVLHFIADFLLQSREMGQKKSSEFLWLIRHLNIQCRVFYAGLLPLFMMGYIDGPKFLFLPLLNTIIHGVIDWYIWRGYKYTVMIRCKPIMADLIEGKKEWKYWEDHLFYSTIGLDQLLHGVTFVGLWYAL